ncbi:MAG: LPS-assembly protein LptD [Deltaproteobacteria bacterium]|nr:LPS-assembly protein LptD [Deltaproteobacteria bacterium]
MPEARSQYPGYKLLYAGLVMAIVLCGSRTAAASFGPWQITADRILHFKNPECLVAEGRVVMTRKNGTISGVKPSPPSAGTGSVPAAPLSPLTITGDWLRLEPGNIVTVRGHAVLDSSEEHITTNAARLDLDHHTGVLHHATLFFPNRHIYMAGEKVKKTGELTYNLVDGWVSKCDPQAGKAPPWSFAWSRATITQEGFAHFINATLRVKNMPVMYSPYFAFSTNQHRKTGLLMPEFSQGGRDGTGILLPLFINLSPSQDLTFYGGGYTRRGIMAGAEYRYVRDKNSHGMFALSYLNDHHKDTPADNFKSDGILQTRRQRYWLRGKMDQDFGQWQGKLDLDLVSDRDYLEEYNSGMLGFIKSDKMFRQQFNRGFASETTYVRANTAQILRSWANMSVNGELRTVDDLTAKPSTQDLWALPRLTFAGSRAILPSELDSSGLRAFAENTDLIWNSEFVDYWRKAGVGGQRLDLHPQLTAPLRISPYLETTATIGVRETLYHVSDNSAIPADYGSGILNRYLYDFNLATSTIFMRDFKLADNRGNLRHIIRPNVSYTYVPYKRQDYLPKMDSTDSVAAKNTIAYGIDNDFDLSGLGGGRRLAYTKVSQSYDIREAQRGLTGPGDHRRPFSDIYIEAGAYPISPLSIIYKTNWNVYGRGILNYELTSSYVNANGNSLGLAYRYYPSQAINQVNINATKKITAALQTQVIFDHSLAADETSEASLRILYKPACWSMEIFANTATNEDYRFTILFNLAGVGNIVGFNRAFNH